MASLGWRIILIIILLTLGLLTGGAHKVSSNKHDNLRLPSYAVPERYVIRLRPDLTHFNFSGTVRIELRILRKTSLLVLNSAKLNIPVGGVQYQTSGDDDEVFKPVEILKSEPDETITLRFNKKIPTGKGSLTIAHFSGNLGDDGLGFYRSKYANNRTKGYMAVTQFEPLGARRCFPCWDEPALKATFEIVLEVPHELTALSNMPVLKEERQEADLKTVYFEESRTMSTYLVAVVVGQFDYVEKFTEDGVRVRVYCPVGNSSQGEFALDTAVRSLDIYKGFFNLPYTLPKLDMIGIPDFSFGGMENFGLVTFLPELLYVDPNSSDLYKQSAATTITHELGHQWTGNLVTMEWWSYLWLNEGFATWLSWFAVDRLFPDSDAWLLFTTESASALTVDALPNYSHPIEMPMHNASDIERIFDPEITYRKGAAVLRMLETYLSPPLFQDSVASYVKKFAWSNVKTQDLWKALEKSSGKPVERVMNKWITKKGFPVLSVDINHNKLKLKQMPFGTGGTQVWVIPVTLACGSYSRYHQFLFHQRQKTFKLDNFIGCSCITNFCPWIKFNVNQTGFYRVRYSKNLLTRLESTIGKNYLSKSDELGILDDLRAFNGTIPVSKPGIV